MATARSSVVDIFLEQKDLTKYRESFHSQGYDTAFDLCVMADKDLDSLGIVDQEERAKILAAGRLYIFIYCIVCINILTKHNISQLPFTAIIVRFSGILRAEFISM